MDMTNVEPVGDLEFEDNDTMNARDTRIEQLLESWQLAYSWTRISC